jgi:flagellar biosynthesis protein FlhG
VQTFFPRLVFSADGDDRDPRTRGAASSRPEAGDALQHAQRVIAVASGKGGVGKTVLSANLGLRLAQLGRRVLLIDADLALANLDLMLGINVTYSVREVLEQRCSLEDALAPGPHGVTLLPACSGDESFANMDNLSRIALFEAIETLSRRFDTLIVDTGAGIGSNAVSFAAAAEQVLIVVTPDPASIADAYAMVKVLSRRGRLRFNLVVNLATNTAEAERVVDRLLTLVDQFLPSVALVPVGIIYRDEVVLRAVRSCEPVLQSFPRSGVASAISALGDRLIREPVGEDTGGPNVFWRRLIGLDAAGPEEGC